VPYFNHLVRHFLYLPYRFNTGGKTGKKIGFA
jgi:hypothetical protein